MKGIMVDYLFDEQKLIIYYFKLTLMKSKKWTPNRNPPSSRLIVDEYDLIQK